MTPSLQVSIVPSVRQSLQLYQYRPDDDPAIFGKPRDCAYGDGCPAVVPLIDAPDLWLTDDWVLYLYAINFGMRVNNVENTISYKSAMANRTGTGNPKEPRRNLLLGEDLDAPLARIDKFRTMSLNTHAGTDDGQTVRLIAMNGRQPPPMKIDPATGKPYPRPRTLEQVVPEHFLHTPQTHRHLFVDLTNVKVKAGNVLGYGPWAHGLVRPWIGDGRMHTFFPFATMLVEPPAPDSHFVYPTSPLSRWIKLPAGSAFPSPFR